MRGMCGRCYDDEVELFPANCDEKPETLTGQPLGMYHCPDCGAMVIAGVPHSDLCKQCIDRTHIFIDGPKKSMKEDVVILDYDPPLLKK